MKPEFATSEQTAACSHSARLMFILMWPHCDDGGVHPASGHKLKAECFPLDTKVTPDHCVDWAAELLSVGLLAEFQAAGKTWWWITGWHHQKIDHPSLKFPQYKDRSPAEGEDLRVVASLRDDSRALASPRQSSPPEGKGREGKGTTTTPPSPSQNEGGVAGVKVRADNPQACQQLVDDWNRFAKWAKAPEAYAFAKSAPSRKQAIMRALREGYDFKGALHIASRSLFIRNAIKEKNWFSLDFLLRPANFQKLMEGKYGGKEGVAVDPMAILEGPRPRGLKELHHAGYSGVQPPEAKDG